MTGKPVPISFICHLLIVFAVFAQAAVARGLAEVIQVPRDYDTITAALAAAPDHSIIKIAGGRYRETLVVERPVTLRGDEEDEAILAAIGDAAVISVLDTEAVTIEGLTIVGGDYGIFITRSQDITIERNLVLDSRLTGIKVRLGAADILNNTVINARAPYGMGIHVTNTMQWAQSNVIGNIVLGNARSGVYTNMTGMIEIADNIVRENGEHGIAVTEMSHADVMGNLVQDNAFTGIQLLDMSMANICDNIIADTHRDAQAQNIRKGNGITVDYHSQATLSGNTIQGSAQHGISVLFGSYAYLHDNNIDDSAEQAVFTDGSEILDGAGCANSH